MAGISVGFRAKVEGVTDGSYGVSVYEFDHPNGFQAGLAHNCHGAIDHSWKGIDQIDNPGHLSQFENPGRLSVWFYPLNATEAQPETHIGFGAIHKDSITARVNLPHAVVWEMAQHLKDGGIKSIEIEGKLIDEAKFRVIGCRIEEY